MDDRIWPLLLVLLIVNVIGIVDGLTFALAKGIKDRVGLGCSLAVISVPISVGLMFVAAWADLILYEMVAPTFGWPKLDLITMLALGWLIGLLWRGATPMRVRVFGNVTTD
jgi:hypothetical protein